MVKHYTIGYHVADQSHRDICTYATDSYEAIKVAKADIKDLQEHPNYIIMWTLVTNLLLALFLQGLFPKED